MQKSVERLFSLKEFVPALREKFEIQRLNLDQVIRVAVAVKDPKAKVLVPAGRERGEISVTDGSSFLEWRVGSLRELFRGTAQPPVLGNYPQAYNDSFALLDFHVLEIGTF